LVIAIGVGEGVKKDPRRGFALSLEAAEALLCVE